ncbi:MAG: AAA family ATPase [Sphingomonas sp.]|uniref:AAA family ATPase n=1 Tax=Sphingomonas sp. TaxID=28214 RepID=UPI0025F4A194|nr:AAA family ATPase [Sphingomonas sp.]MBX9882893.1 AAA family ATPase [Sphingomonas sp.]
MITRIEIDGFKSFQDFGVNLQPFTALVGPNASGKSNLFDALRFLSLLAKHDIRHAMQGLRGEPEELFRRTAQETSTKMSFAVEALLPKHGTDAFGASYDVPAQRLRYELELGLQNGRDGSPRRVQVIKEFCRPLSKAEDRARAILKNISVNYTKVSPFIRLSESGEAIEVRQDGRQKRGRPVTLSLKEASRTALSTITTAEFPHLYALRDAIYNISFLEINPHAARMTNDRFEEPLLKSDASNLAAVLARLKDETASHQRPEGILADIAADLSSLIPSVKRLESSSDNLQRQYAFSLRFADDMSFSSRVISDGTLRLLALLTILNDPDRKGTLCFEEPENGVHEGRISALIKFLRDAAVVSTDPKYPAFQILIATHSPKVMECLRDEEIVAADTVVVIGRNPPGRTIRTRMRTGVQPVGDMFNPENHLVRSEIEALLQRSVDAA